MTSDYNKRKQAIVNTFDLAAMGYDGPALRFFPVSAEWLAGDLQLIGNEKVLDVATGTGVVALAVARKLKNGTVIGIDISRNMLAQAKEKAELSAIRNVSFRMMDADMLHFPDDYFDAISCGFGIFFMEDIVQCLRKMSCYLKKNAKFAATSFLENSFEPMSSAFLQRIKMYGVDTPDLSIKKTDTPEKLTNLFLEAGFERVQVQPRSLGYYLPNAQAWWDLLWNAGYRGLLNQLSENDLQRFQQEHCQEIRPLLTEKGIWLEVNVLFALACKPD